MWVRAPAGGDSQLLKASADISYVLQIGRIPMLLCARSASHHQITLPPTFSAHALFKCGVRPSALPVIVSCLGIIPCNGADKQSSSCGVTWTATSTG